MNEKETKEELLVAESQNTCIGDFSKVTTGMGCVALGYPNLDCPAFGSGCENTIIGRTFSEYKKLG